MEIKEKGKDVEWKREIECPHCGSKLTISADDILYTTRYEPTESDCPVYYIRCPVCGPKLNLQDCHYVFLIDIPVHVMLYARNRHLKAKEKKEEATHRKDTRRALVFLLLIVSAVIFYFSYIAK